MSTAWRARAGELVAEVVSEKRVESCDHCQNDVDGNGSALRKIYDCAGLWKRVWICAAKTHCDVGEGVEDHRGNPGVSGKVENVEVVGKRAVCGGETEGRFLETDNGGRGVELPEVVDTTEDAGCGCERKNAAVGWRRRGVCSTELCPD